MDFRDLKSKKFLRGLVISLSAVATGFVVKKGLDMVYEKISKQQPPDQYDRENANLVKFLAYSVITGVVINLAKNAVMKSGTELIEGKGIDV